MSLSPKQFQMFNAVDKDGVEDKELTPNEAVDYTYWMNSANPGRKYSVRH